MASRDNLEAVYGANPTREEPGIYAPQRVRTRRRKNMGAVVKVSIGLLVAAGVVAGGIFVWSEMGLAQGDTKTKSAPKASETKSSVVRPPAEAKGGAASVGDMFGEWAYQCDPLAPNAPKGTTPDCYISQARLTKNENGEQSRMLLVNVSRTGTERRPMMFVFLPWGAAVQNEIPITIDGGAGFKGAVDTCLASGCRVPFLLGDDILDRLRKGNTMQVTFSPVGGTPLTVEVTLAGFTAGLNALK